MSAPDSMLDKRSGLVGSALGVWAELKANRRAAWGLCAIGLLVGLYGLILIDDAGDARRAAYVEASLRLQRLTAESGQTQWPARAAASGTVRKQLEARLWPVESEGVARADMQDWVTNAGRTAGLDRLQLRIESSHPETLPADLRRVTATLTAVPTEPALLQFLALVARDPHMIVVDRLHVTQRPAPAMEMTLSTYARLGAGGARR